MRYLYSKYEILEGRCWFLAHKTFFLSSNVVVIETIVVFFV